MELNLKENSEFNMLVEDIDNKGLYSDKSEHVKECDSGAVNTSASTGLAGEVPENCTVVNKCPVNTKKPLTKTEERIEARKNKNKDLDEAIRNDDINGYAKKIKESIIKKTTHVIDLSKLEDKIQNDVQKFYGKALNVDIEKIDDSTLVGNFKYKAGTFGNVSLNDDIDKAELSSMFQNPGSPLNDVSIMTIFVGHSKDNSEILRIKFDVTNVTVMEDSDKSEHVKEEVEHLNSGEAENDDMLDDDLVNKEFPVAQDDTSSEEFNDDDDDVYDESFGKETEKLPQEEDDYDIENSDRNYFNTNPDADADLHNLYVENSDDYDGFIDDAVNSGYSEEDADSFWNKMERLNDVSDSFFFEKRNSRISDKGILSEAKKKEEDEEPEKFARRRYQPGKVLVGGGKESDTEYETKLRPEWRKRRIGADGIDKTTRGEEYFNSPNYNPIGRTNANIRFVDGQDDAFMAWYNDYFEGKQKGKVNYPTHEIKD